MRWMTRSLNFLEKATAFSSFGVDLDFPFHGPHAYLVQLVLYSLVRKRGPLALSQMHMSSIYRPNCDTKYL